MIRGIAHIHSTYSYDASLSLEQIREHCLARGLSFALMSEHTDDLEAEAARSFVQACRHLSDAQFRFIPGFEVTIPKAHILAFGADRFDPALPFLATLQDMKARGAWLGFAHPHRSGFLLPPEILEIVDGVEVWNAQYDGKRVPRTASVRLLSQRDGWLASAGLDLHRASHFGGPEIRMEAPREEEAILRAFKGGSFVFAQGERQYPSRGVSLTGFDRLSSAASIGAVSLGKACASLAKKSGIRIPRSLKERIRSWI